MPPIFCTTSSPNDIKHLQANQACYATYNTPKGRVIANLIAQNTGNEILLALAARFSRSRG